VLLASYNGFHVFLSHLAVAPSERRRGVGARLHEELVRLAARDGARGVIADAQLSAVGFFERVGYRTPGAVFLIRDVESRRTAP
jgi:predicted N-acetyltransferase YhbS